MDWSGKQPREGKVKAAKSRVTFVRKAKVDNLKQANIF